MMRCRVPKWPAVMMAAVLLACGGQGVPTAEDVPAILAEAQGSESVSKWRDSDARRAVRSSFKMLLYFDSVHVAEVSRRFQRPELRSYLMLDDSYIGGEFPRRIALLLREVQEADRNYLLQVASYPDLLKERLASVDLATAERNALETEITRAVAARQQPVVEALTVFDTFVSSAASLYEMAAANPGAFRSMRTGLEISSGALLGRFNATVNEVNRAHEAADSAIRRLDPEHQARFRRMGVATPVASR